MAAAASGSSVVAVPEDDPARKAHLAMLKQLPPPTDEQYADLNDFPGFEGLTEDEKMEIIDAWCLTGVGYNIALATSRQMGSDPRQNEQSGRGVFGRTTTEVGGDFGRSTRLTQGAVLYPIRERRRRII